jgi:PAS domain S-box-containing protein
VTPHITQGWKAILKIGYDPSLSGLERSRTMLLNGLAVATSLTVFCFFISFKIVGYQYYYGPLYIIPFAFLVLFFNKEKKYSVARSLYVLGSLVVISYWCYEGRRNGNEYPLIAVATTATLIFNRKSVVYLVNFLCAAIFVIYKFYDVSQPFVPDPAINYNLLPAITLISTVGMLSYQMAFFKDLAHHYDNKLLIKYQELNEALDKQQKAEEELMTSNEELTSSNEQLYELTNQLEVLVKQKSVELQSYIDAINVNICSAVTGRDGKISKVNEPLLGISGYTEKELLGQNFSLLNSGYHPESYFKDFWETILANKTWRGEIKNKRKDGSFFWIDMVILPIKGNEGSIDYFLTLAMPITERKLNEEARENSMLLMENIAFRTSHEIRGPLARIEGLANLVRKDFITTDEFKSVAGQLIHCTKELNNATSELVNFVNTHRSSIQKATKA